MRQWWTNVWDAKGERYYSIDRHTGEVFEHNDLTRLQFWLLVVMGPGSGLLLAIIMGYMVS